MKGPANERSRWMRWPALAAMVGALLVIGLAFTPRRHSPSRSAAMSDEERSADEGAPGPVASTRPPHARERRPPLAASPGFDRPAAPRLAAPRARPGVLDWTSPGLCEDGTTAAANKERQEALVRNFRRDDVNGVVLAHDEGVTAETLQVVRFALGRTRQFSDYLLGWSPRDFPPPIYIYRDVEQLRSVACVNGTDIAYYDGSIHLTGDSRYGSATLTEETAHEYVHHILSTIGVGRPIWLHEGLAMQIAGERWWKKPELGLPDWLQREHLSFDALVDALPHAARDGHRANQAYYQSYMMVAFIRQRRPAGYIRELLDDLAWRRLSPDQAFLAAASVAPGPALEAEWALFLRSHHDL